MTRNNQPKPWHGIIGLEERATLASRTTSAPAAARRFRARASWCRMFP